MPPLLQLQKNYRGKVMEGGQKVYLRVVVAFFFFFFLVGGADQRSRFRGENAFGGIL